MPPRLSSATGADSADDVLFSQPSNQETTVCELPGDAFGSTTVREGFISVNFLMRKFFPRRKSQQYEKEAERYLNSFLSSGVLWLAGMGRWCFDKILAQSMEVLLLQDQDEVRERVVFSLESKFNAKVREVKSITSAIESLKAGKVDALIYDYLKGEPSEFQSLWSLVSEIPCVLVSQKSQVNRSLPSDVRVVAEVDRANMVDGILKAFEAMIGEGSVPYRLPGNGYCRIRTRLLLSVSPLKADVFIRLSDTHYVKLFAQGDVFDRQDLEKYTLKKGVEYLFLKHESTDEFVEKYRAELAKLLRSEKTPVDELISASDTLHEAAQELVSTLGFTPKIQELARTQVDLTIRTMARSRRLSELLDRFRAGHGKYINSHSTLVALVACGIAARMDWASETTYQKLCLAAFLHDITLSNHELAKIPSLKSLEAVAENFTAREFREYKFHPIQAADLVKQMTQILPDVDSIILQHHEWPDGSGFPRGITHSHIHPLASAFIIAHDVVRKMIEPGSTTTLESYATENQGRFSAGHFKKIMRTLPT